MRTTTSKMLLVLPVMLILPAVLLAPRWARALALVGALSCWGAARLVRVLEKRATLAQTGRTAPPTTPASSEPITGSDGHPGASSPASPEAVDAFVRRLSARTDTPVRVPGGQWVAPNDLRRES